MERLAAESTHKGYTVPGVQKKLSLHLFSDKQQPRLTLVNYPTGYIVKPQVDEFEALPETEQMVMGLADLTGISTVPHALIQINDGLAYITKRVDRQLGKDDVRKLAMEDFCQLDLRLTQDKYKGSYERCAKIIDRYSSRRGLDMTELYLRVVFSFVVGNSDMHLKNFSLIETEERSNTYVLSPAYDMLPVNVIMPEDTEQMALALHGKKRNIHRRDFMAFASVCGISKSAADKMNSRVLHMQKKYETWCRESAVPKPLQERFIQLMKERMQCLA